MGLQLLTERPGGGRAARGPRAAVALGWGAPIAMAVAVAGLVACGGGSGADGSRLRPPPLVSAVQVHPPYPWIDRRVDFRATCQGRAPFTFDWDFGDGQRAAAAGAEVSHAYRAAGSYRLAVTCQDDNGRSLTEVRTVRVDARDLASVADSACYSDYMGHGWCRQAPRVSGPLYGQLVAAGAEVVWGVGRHGNVRRSVNLNQIFWMEEVLALAVAMPQRAWAATEGTVRYTWSADTYDWNPTAVWQYPRSPPIGPVTQLQAAGPEVVWAVGGPADTLTVQRTLDGGQTWAATPAQPTLPPGLRTVFARDADRAWVVGPNGQLQRTADGGTTWEPVAPPPGQAPGQADTSIAPLVGLNPERSVAWLVWGGREVALLKLDSGEWETLGAPPGGGTISSVSAFGEETAWFAGRTAGTPTRGLLLRVDGSGTQRRWRNFSVPSGEQGLRSVAAYSRDGAWVAGERSLLDVTLARTTIVSEAVGATDEHLIGFSAVDASVAWALGAGGALVTTDNGGSEWVRSLGTAPSGSLGLLALDTRRAWAIDGAGALQLTSDTGLSWRSAADNQPGGLLALVRGGPEGHWLMGRKGVVALGSESAGMAGGATSVTLGAVACGLPTTLDFGAGAARDARTAWLLAGPSNSTEPARWTELWQITEGGRSCRAVALEGVGALHAVALAGDAEIWVAGNAGPEPGSTVVWRSTDAGQTWQRHAMPWIDDAVALVAWPGSGAWLVSSEVVWRLQPDGDQLQWHAQLWLEPGEQPMLQLQMFSDETLWGAGADGQIWRTMTGGEVVPP